MRWFMSMFLRRVTLCLALISFAVSCLPLSAQGAIPSCYDKREVISGDRDFSLVASGTRRTYRVHVPPSYQSSRTVPVVFIFHGGFGTGKFMQKQARMDRVSDANGFLTVYPDGLFRTWNAGGCCEKAMELNVDDVGFVSALIDKLDADFCIDTRRIFAAGFSNGAMLAHRIACELSEKIAAIAAVSGVIMVSRCEPKRPLSVMVFHGTADPRSLWEGGIGDKNPRKGSRASIKQTMETLASRYKCSDSSEKSFERGEVTCVTRRPCEGDNEVILCKIDGGGHQWPGGEPVWPKKLGHITYDISASEAMWGFFQKHQMTEGSRTK